MEVVSVQISRVLKKTNTVFEPGPCMLGCFTHLKDGLPVMVICIPESS